MASDRQAAKSDRSDSIGHRHRSSLGPLHPGGAFVVRFHSASGKTRRTTGKVEHVQSGEELQFQSRKELLDFLLRTFPGEPDASG
jgi:hypothetical protein